jgi:hypothetical protein
MGELSNWAQENSPFLKIPDNGQVRVIYRGYQKVDDNRNPGKTKIRYKVELNGQVKWFESAAARIAMSFDSIKEGEEVIIKKSFENGKNKYEVVLPDQKTEDKNKKVEAV